LRETKTFPLRNLFRSLLLILSSINDHHGDSPVSNASILKVL
jgi:hypothetical protein